MLMNIIIKINLFLLKDDLKIINGDAIFCGNNRKPPCNTSFINGYPIMCFNRKY